MLLLLEDTFIRNVTWIHRTSEYVVLSPNLYSQILVSEVRGSKSLSQSSTL